MDKLLLILGLCGLSTSLCMAQAGDQPFEELDVISLPGKHLAKPALRLNWDCDVLLPSTDARYRPGSCGDKSHLEGAKEIPLESVKIESARDSNKARRKLQY